MKRKPKDEQAAAVVDSTPVVETPENDAIAAALAAIEAEVAENPEIAETVVDVLEEAIENVEAASGGEEDVNVDEVLAQVAADTPAPTTTGKRARKNANATPAPTPAATRSFHDVASIDKATFDRNLEECNAGKVQEKAKNLIQAIETGKKLSRYTGTAIKKFVADGRVTGKSLAEAFQGEGLSIGTARAQAQQMTALFKIAGIAGPDTNAPRELVIADAALANELVRLAA